MTPTATRRDEVDATVKQEQRNGMVRYDTFDGGGNGRSMSTRSSVFCSLASGLRRALKL